MILSYIHASRTTHNTVRLQAVHAGFPRGYTSGEANGSVEGNEAFVPSFRGSGRLYIPLVVKSGNLYAPNGNVVCSVAHAVECLGGPSPAYDASQTNAVSTRITGSLAIAAKGLPTPPTTVSALTAQAVAKAVGDAVAAALKTLGLAA